MKKKTINFCSSCSKCPVIEMKEHAVYIGEKNNVCKLTEQQWNDLVKTIKEL